MPRPLVALVARHLPAGRVRGARGPFFGVPEAYIGALRRAGARVVVLCPPADATPSELLEGCEALLLTGGGDIEPRRYGEEPHPEVYGLEPDRDEMEIELVHEALDRRLPTLAICRGAQVVNVALGGTLHQHLADIDGMEPHGAPLQGTSITHEIRLTPDCRAAEAAGRELVIGTSHHHQGIAKLGDGLVATGWSPDGLVEVLEHEDAGWLVAVQWHPEDTAATDPAQQGLFDGLVKAATGNR